MIALIVIIGLEIIAIVTLLVMAHEFTKDDS